MNRENAETKERTEAVSYAGLSFCWCHLPAHHHDAHRYHASLTLNHTACSISSIGSEELVIICLQRYSSETTWGLISLLVSSVHTQITYCNYSAESTSNRSIHCVKPLPCSQWLRAQLCSHCKIPKYFSTWDFTNWKSNSNIKAFSLYREWDQE